MAALPVANKASLTARALLCALFGVPGDLQSSKLCFGGLLFPPWHSLCATEVQPHHDDDHTNHKLFCRQQHCYSALCFAAPVATIAASTANWSCFSAIQVLGVPVATTAGVQVNATFAGVPVTVTVAANSTGVDCTAVMSVSAANVDLSPVIPGLWPEAPTIVRNSLNGIVFPRMESAASSGMPMQSVDFQRFGVLGQCGILKD